VLRAALAETSTFCLKQWGIAGLKIECALLCPLLFRAGFSSNVILPHQM
jgi:hypothetical protein